MNIKILSFLVIGIFFIAGCAQVKTTKLGGDDYQISQFQSGVLTSYENQSLQRQAEKLCPKGYSFLNRQAISSVEFAQHHAECAQGQSCGYELQWRIRCGEIPREPFSLFGKTK